MEALSRTLLAKLLHAPTVRLREAAGNGRGTAVLDTARYLFQLDRDTAQQARDDQEPSAPAPPGPPAPSAPNPKPVS